MEYEEESRDIEVEYHEKRKETRIEEESPINPNNLG
jgi:hypothetical protein